MTLAEFINKAIYVKFKDKGRDYSGWDCWAIPYLAYQDVLNIKLPSFVDEYINPGDDKASRRAINDIVLSQKHNWDKVIIPEALDIVVFRFGDTRTHVGLMIGKDKFIHCERKVNTIIEPIKSAKWEKRIEGIYRLKDKNAK